jgi:iduronate 2-sulfatase
MLSGNTLAVLFTYAYVHAFGPDNTQYNVLYLIADDLRPQLAAAYGQKAMLTPNIDKLAASGSVFQRAYCSQAVCGPSRNSFMTGRRPHHTNVDATNTGDDFRTVGMDAAGKEGSQWITMPEHFKQHNFTTLGGGKTFHPGTPPQFDYPTSWSDWRGQPRQFASNYFDYSYWLDNKTTKVPYGGPCPGHPGPTPSSDPAVPDGLSGPIAVWCGLDEPDDHFYDNGLANDTIARLRYAAKIFKSEGRPFYIQSGFARPHTPWRVPQRFWDLYNTDAITLAVHKLPPPNMPGVAWMAHSFYNASTGATFPMNITHPLEDKVARTARHAYYASVSWFDYQVGRVLDELALLELESKTIVVVHGDHGWQLGEHNSWHKYTNFELGVRVPLIIRAPMLPASIGQVIHGLAELVDVYPTLAELAGTGAPTDQLDGVSLLPFLQEPTRRSFPTSRMQGTLNKTVAFSQYPHGDNGLLVPASTCPFFYNGGCHPFPTTSGGGA